MENWKYDDTARTHLQGHLPSLPPGSGLHPGADGQRQPGKIKLKEVSIDTEAGLKLAQKHDLYQLPGILVNGKLAIEGATTKQEIKEALEAVK